MDLLDALGAGRHFRVDRDAAGRAHAETRLEILIGVVEDDIAPVAYRLPALRDLGRELVEVGREFFGIGLIYGGSLLVETAERLGERQGDQLGIFRVHPDMR